MIPDPTYALSLLARAFTQTRAATQEGAKQRAFQQEQFEAQREEQRRQTQERRAQEWALAERQRQSNLELQENQKVLDNWPLRLFPSQILKSHRTDGPTPLRVLLSMPDTGPRDLEGPVRQALQQFVSTHYNFNLGVRPVELLDGAWKDDGLQGASSIKALHERLRSEPTLVLETQMPEGDDCLYVNLAYWGPAQDRYLYQVLDKIAYRSIVEEAARAGARQWRQARATLIAKGLAQDPADADRRLGGARAANLQRLEQEEALAEAGIGLDQVALPPFQLGKDDYRAIHHFLVVWHCLTLSWIADLYHFSYWDAPPLLPTLLPDLLYLDFPPDVVRALIDHYCRSYRAVATERPAWAPELTLQLASSLAALPDSHWAWEQVESATRRWLELRGLPAIEGQGPSFVEGFCTLVGAPDGLIGSAFLQDKGFRASLRNAIERLKESDLVERLEIAENDAVRRRDLERLEQDRFEQEQHERQERERVARLEQPRREHLEARGSTEISRTALFGKLNPLAYKAIESATVYCKMRGNPYVELVHWFNQILQGQDSDLHRIIRRFQLDPAGLARDFTESLDRLPRGLRSISDLSSEVEEAAERAWTYSTLLFGESQVRTGHLMVGILKTKSLRNVLLGISRQFDKIQTDTLTEEFPKICSGSPEERMHAIDGASFRP